MSEVEIAMRRAHGFELETLADLWFRSARATHTFLPMLQALDVPAARRVFAEHIAPDVEFHVAELDGEIVGLLGLDGDLIDQLYVDPVHQNQGIGRQLLDYAQSLWPGPLYLFTHQKNAGARRFYERHGFRPIRFGISPAPESEPDVEYRRDGGSL